MNTIKTNTTSASPAFAATAIVGVLALSVAAIGSALRDYYSVADRTASTRASSTGADNQEANRNQVVNYITEVGEALAAE